MGFNSGFKGLIKSQMAKLQKHNVGLFLVCAKGTGVFSNETAAVEHTWKTTDKREENTDVLPIKIKCNIREYYTEK